LGAEIYAKFATRQIEDVMTKTPYDYRLITNEPEQFSEVLSKYPTRVVITCDKLENERIMVGPFNQMLKYKTMKDVPAKYDWLWYMDCDAGLCEAIDPTRIDALVEMWESQGFDIIGTRANAVLKNELLDHETKIEEWKTKIAAGEKNPHLVTNLFSAKFIFYNVSSKSGPSEWMNACLPSEHVLFIKNSDKLAKMASYFQEFNRKFETQTEPLTTWDMEAFEIGVSALLAGYNMGDFGNHHGDDFKVRFNYNNWEKVKY
jgi:hypothetical protein